MPEDTKAAAKRPAPPPRPQRRTRARHRLLSLSFVLLVAVPSLIALAYLFLRAADQYHSTTAFSVRAEEAAPQLGALSALAGTASASGTDAAILYDFIQSQAMVDKVAAEIDLATIYNLPSLDPVFTLGAGATKEDLVAYWNRMVRVSVDENHILTVETRAFQPEDSVAIADVILRESTAMVNRLSKVAAEDATRYAREDLADAEAKLKDLRLAIRDFRNTNQLIDPEATVQSQMGVISALQAQLAETLIERATQLPSRDANDPRIEEIDRKIAAIRERIEEERALVSDGGGAEGADTSLSAVIGEYEELLVDLEFAQNSYTTALAAVSAATAEARRQSRYVAVHIPPTLAEESLYPQRWLLWFLVLLGSFGIWSVLVLLYYNSRERG